MFWDNVVRWESWGGSYQLVQAELSEASPTILYTQKWITVKKQNLKFRTQWWSENNWPFLFACFVLPLTQIVWIVRWIYRYQASREDSIWLYWRDTSIDRIWSNELPLLKMQQRTKRREKVDWKKKSFFSLWFAKDLRLVVSVTTFLHHSLSAFTSSFFCFLTSFRNTTSFFFGFTGLDRLIYWLFKKN